MKKLLTIIPLVILLCFAFSCQQGEEVAEEPAEDIEADIEAIRDWVNGNYAAADSGDLEGYLSFWAEDIVWMPPNAPIMKGKSSIGEYVKPFFEQLTIHHEISIEEIKTAEDFASTRLNSKEKYTPKTGEGEPMELNVKAIFLLQRMSDGTWLCTHGIWNSNDPLPTSEENQ
jgi:uncharacterized protein (TIGR02246 family)